MRPEMRPKNLDEYDYKHKILFLYLNRQQWRGRKLPMRLCFVKFVCQNKRIGTLEGACHVRPPWIPHWTVIKQVNITVNDQKILIKHLLYNQWLLK